MNYLLTYNILRISLFLIINYSLLIFNYLQMGDMT